MRLLQIKRFFLGAPLTSGQSTEELIPKWKALATLSSDALSSVAYATEAALAVLVAYSAMATFWNFPLAIGITLLLIILTASYRQTIEAYPNGGGAYTVAKENLGLYPGLIAGTSLLIDYVLTVAVSISAGMDNIIATFPILTEHRVGLGILAILAITLINLRGVRESATFFALPTYFFIFSIFALIGKGLWQYLLGDQATFPVPSGSSYMAVPFVLILRAFGSGCSALTGIEAISNSVPIFRPSAKRNAKITLVLMATILATLFLGISFLAWAYGILPMRNETVISALGQTLFGRSIMYHVIQFSTAMILFLAANTSFTGFPRLASLLAKDRFLPRQLAVVGDRLFFSNGVSILGLTASALILFFKGETLHMIPLYALGVFVSFTLSQSGMVLHHLRERKTGWIQSLSFNALGAITTFAVLSDIAFTKFFHGAWIVVIAIPLLVLLFRSIHSHYRTIGLQLTIQDLKPWAHPKKFKHTVIVPISGVHRGILDAIRYAISISGDVRAVYVNLDPEQGELIKNQWEEWAPEIPFVVLESPFRSVLFPILEYIEDIRQTTHDDVITVLIPEFVTPHWWHRFLHNQTAILIRAALTFKRGVIVTSVRYHLHK